MHRDELQGCDLACAILERQAHQIRANAYRARDIISRNTHDQRMRSEVVKQLIAWKSEQKFPGCVRSTVKVAVFE
jgi:hypothetical protein